jgi:hypothetical protein
MQGRGKRGLDLKFLEESNSNQISPMINIIYNIILIILNYKLVFK